ncbi:MAG: hypothetical protein OM95_16535 [Bdellovibrio sp. ArHS]|uniref:hypothetical protein n=1 Tax=Bdellovibrio sp. ArHS TaxID=1569284 RepID=UPI000583639A|nr:hypothetical protein [Bdellovibrio sp. ArHS]KHD87065.1 MAG: hypothetical protein OM95_16535 [Bdellovibrio sp. ArHS]
MNFFAENLQVFKKVCLPLFALVVLSSNIDQYLNLHIENALRDPHGAQQQVYWLGFLSIISSVVFPVLLITLALYALNTLTGWNKTLGEFMEKNLNQVFIETLRSWGKTLLWSLLLILPGLWKYIEYSLVPLVVTSSERYDQGKEDALQRSAQIVRRNWPKVLGVFVLFHLFIPVVLSALFDAYRLIWKTPVASLTLSALDTYLLVLSTQILFNIFRSEVRKHDAHV